MNAQIKYPQYQKRVILPMLQQETVTIDGVEHAVCLIDVYDFLDAFEVNNPATQHALKKIVRAGKDHNTAETDIEESQDSLRRAAQIERKKRVS